MSEELNFGDIEIREVSIVGPDKKHYILREPTSKVSKAHRNAILKASKLGPNGRVVGVDGLASVEVPYVAGCLWDENKLNPPAALLESWPERVVSKLYEKAKELSGETEAHGLRSILADALGLPSSPIAKEILQEWSQGLRDEKFKPLKTLFDFDSEGEAKN